jgi:hypothetical protein
MACGKPGSLWQLGEIAAVIIADKGFPDTAHLPVTKMIGLASSLDAGRSLRR